MKYIECCSAEINDSDDDIDILTIRKYITHNFD